MTDTIADAARTECPPHTPGTHRFSQMERVYWGTTVSEALLRELEIVGARRVFVVTNRSLATTERLTSIIHSLGDRFVGTSAGVTAHAPRECAVAAADLARRAGADLLLAVGGGSVIDAAKAALLCLRHGYTTTDQLEPHANVRIPDNGHAPTDAHQWRRLIAVPTTLSAAEFASTAGLTEPSRGLKQAFSNPMQMPQAVILDPAMTLSTPPRLLKSTGMKAIDHAAERLTSKAANDYSNVVSESALHLLAEGLARLDRYPEDLSLRSRLQYGMFMSMSGAAAGVAVNVSHALGHVLGGHSRVPHGETTGLVLPSVLTWNREFTGEAQARIASALGASSVDAAVAIRSLAQQLLLPTRLRDVGVARNQLSELARKAMHEPLLANSSRPVEGPADLEAILESAW